MPIIKKTGGVDRKLELAEQAQPGRSKMKQNLQQKRLNMGYSAARLIRMSDGWEAA